MWYKINSSNLYCAVSFVQLINIRGFIVASLKRLRNVCFQKIHRLWLGILKTNQLVKQCQRWKSRISTSLWFPITFLFPDLISFAIVAQLFSWSVTERFAIYLQYYILTPLLCVPKYARSMLFQGLFFFFFFFDQLFTFSFGIAFAKCCA